ncbi:hypothetical protein KSS87_018893 [Heliosperma pusillum]|nr:hypothetical protein KSS87_018893 [Heliosperma pusillum]
MNGENREVKKEKKKKEKISSTCKFCCLTSTTSALLLPHYSSLLSSSFYFISLTTTAPFYFWPLSIYYAALFSSLSSRNPCFGFIALNPCHGPTSPLQVGFGVCYSFDLLSPVFDFAFFGLLNLVRLHSYSLCFFAAVVLDVRSGFHGRIPFQFLVVSPFRVAYSQVSFVSVIHLLILTEVVCCLASWSFGQPKRVARKVKKMKFAKIEWSRSYGIGHELAECVDYDVKKHAAGFSVTNTSIYRIMDDFGLNEMEMNMSFTDLLNRPQMNNIFEEDIGLNVADETIVLHEGPLNEIDYDENGSDVDDDEIIDARTTHKKNEILEKESQHELERLGEQLQRDNVRYDIDSDYDDEFDVNSPTASSGEDEYGYLTTPASNGQNSKPQKANVDSFNSIDTTFFVEQKFENAVEFRKKIVDYCARNGVDVRSDHNNTIKFQLNANVFHRMYICFAALREGFLAGCRPFISIDGCWLKGPYGGQLLVAVGRDGNNQMFPIAWAVVDVENTESWSWFLQLLAEDLRTLAGAGYTIMSDQQKGLLKAVAETWPQAEQRVCARHVYMNFREVFGGGQEYRMHFWKIAKSTTPNEFKENIDKLGDISPEAAADLMGRNYEKWCRAFYTPQCQCDAVDNNMSEVFNAYILNSRHKPIITMLEDIRESIMERLHKKRDFIRSKNLAICPRAQEQLEKAKITARGWNSVFGGKFTIGVREGATQVRYVVDLLNKTCSCNAWQLSGIPCNHSVAAIWHNKERPEAYVAECYKKSMYLKAYMTI